MKRQLFIILKRIIPRSMRRKLQWFMPDRLVMTLDEANTSVKFVFYPHKRGEDFGLLADHEVALRNTLPLLIKENDIAFDIGAHYGLYTILMASLVKSKGQVHAFDPFESNIQRVKENVNINGLTNVVLNTVAVSNQTGTTNIIGNSFKTASIKSTHKNETNVVVFTTDIDSYWQNLGCPNVKLIKIDVEGAEDLVIEGMQKLLSDCKPILLLEIHLFALSSAEVEALLSNLLEKHSYSGYLEEIMYGNAKYASDFTTKQVTVRTFIDMTQSAHTAFLRLIHKTQNAVPIPGSIS